MDTSTLKYVIPKLNVNANNNVTQLVPDYSVPYWINGPSHYGVLRIDPTHTSSFTVDLSEANVTYTDGISNTVDVYGQIHSYSNRPFYYFAFVVDPEIAVNYPGLEYTVHFIRNSVPYNTYVGVYANATLTSNDEDSNDFYLLNKSCHLK